MSMDDRELIELCAKMRADAAGRREVAAGMMNADGEEAQLAEAERLERLADHISALSTGRAREGFAPCPTCRQYSHSIGGDKLADAFNHFQSMFSHRGDGIPTQFNFDQTTRDAAQVLMAAARSTLSTDREAIRAEAFEEAAKVAEDHMPEQDHTVASASARATARSIATAIRALGDRK